jgi:hypothetical protein
MTKFNIGDKVKFTLNGKELTGVVYYCGEKVIAVTCGDGCVIAGVYSSELTLI